MRHALVAQLDRVTGYEPVGRGFESLPARQIKANRFLRFAFIFCSNPEGTRTRASSSEQASYRLFRLLFFPVQAGSALTALFLLYPKVLPAQIFWVPTMRSTRVFGRTVRGTVRYRVRALPARHVVADFISFATAFLFPGQNRLSLIPSLLLSPKSFACANLSGGPMKTQHRFCVHLFFEKDSSTSVLAGTSFISLVPAFVFSGSSRMRPARTGTLHAAAVRRRITGGLRDRGGCRRSSRRQAARLRAHTRTPQPRFHTPFWCRSCRRGNRPPG